MIVNIKKKLTIKDFNKGFKIWFPPALIYILLYGFFLTDKGLSLLISNKLFVVTFLILAFFSLPGLIYDNFILATLPFLVFLFLLINYILLIIAKKTPLWYHLLFWFFTLFYVVASFIGILIGFVAHP